MGFLDYIKGLLRRQKSSGERMDEINDIKNHINKDNNEANR